MNFSFAQQSVFEHSVIGTANMTGVDIVVKTPYYPDSTQTPGTSPAFNIKPLNTKIKSAKIYVLLNLGADYNLGEHEFSLPVDFSLIGVNSSNGIIVPTIHKNLLINEDTPETIFVYDFSNDVEQIREFVFTVTPPTGSFPTNSTINTIIQDSARLKFYYEIDYGVDVRTLTGVPAPLINNSNPIFYTRVHTFDWSSTPYNFPNYEFELLRLHNSSVANLSDQNIITAKLDWSKALKIETQSSSKQIKIAVTEGTGFYIWRVRAIGSFYEGSIANFQNFGQWSSAPPTGTILNLNKNADVTGGSSSLCYFTDPDDNINWIYNRVFTEGNRISENISYANGLSQIIQSQARIQSKESTIVSQSIIDYSGRPALSTLPVPVIESEMYKFKSGFVKNSSGETYTAKDFENFDVNGRNINSPVDSSLTTSDYFYYSDNNTDLNIPSANGYPFSRTLFYNDGSGRVKEQSGPGKIHSMGSQIDGKGRTVRTYYGTPSNDELLRVFGDEAPIETSVFKTITVDANNTESVVYTSKEGNVIATCLVKNSPNNLNPLSSEPENYEGYTVNNQTTVNVPAENGFISTKRLSFSSITKVDISYRMECENLPLCPVSDSDCNYIVELFIHNISENYSYTSGQMSLPSCDGLYRTISSINWYPISGAPTLALESSSGKPLLEPGNYIIEKRIFTSTDAQASIAGSSMEKVQKAIKPLVNLVLGMLEIVNDENGLIGFYENINTLSANIATDKQSPNPGLYYTIPGLDSMLRSPDDSISFDQPYDPLALTPTRPNFLNIKAGCCNSMKIPVRYTPLISCFEPSELVTYYNDNWQELDNGYLLDFEGYAKARLGLSLNSMDTMFKGYNLLDNEFNFMIYHMLVDEYNIEDRNDSTLIVNKRQYDCERLWACWINVVSQFESAQLLNMDPQTDNHNVAKGADDSMDEGGSTEDSPESTVNNESDKNAKESPGIAQWLLDWITAKKLRKELRKDRSGAGDSESPQNAFVANLPKLFLECAGYQFAQILDTNGIPTFYPDDAIHYVKNKPVTVNSGLVNFGKPTFPYIIDPKYAFKYFVYTQADIVNPSASTNGNFPAYIDLEFSHCFVEPPSDLCIKPACASRTHLNWSGAERHNFYLDNVGYMPVPQTEFEDLSYDCPTPQNYLGIFDTLFINCNTTCESRRDGFRNGIIKMFLENCYQIGGCATDTNNIVTDTDIEKIVDAIVGDCIGQCDTIKIRVSATVGSYSPLEEDFNNPNSATTAYPKEYLRNCKIFSGSGYEEVSYCDVLLLPKCERERITQIQSWNFIPDLPQIDKKCEHKSDEAVWWGNLADPCTFQSPSSPNAPFSKVYEVNVITP
ncbi:MAG: hypothetical protein H0V01_04470 [Bacteroidetes bacterium]|nr:hypothetical protein [Bacteroidota bacterium]